MFYKPEKGEIYMKNTSVIIVILSLIIICCGCTRVIETASDEIKSNKWKMTTDFGKKVVLKFSGDTAIFRVKSKDKFACVVIKGLCVIDSKKISIFNNSDKENYTFRYKLKGNRLRLKYMGGQINLIRQKK